MKAITETSLNVENVKNLINKVVVWHITEKNGAGLYEFSGKDIILGLDFSQPYPIKAQSLYGDGLSMAWVGESGDPRSFKYSTLGWDIMFSIDEDCIDSFEVGTNLPKESYGESLNTILTTLEDIVSGSDSQPVIYYVTRNRHFYRENADEFGNHDESTFISDYMDAYGNGIDSVDDDNVSFFLNKNDAAEYAKALCDDANKWQKYNEFADKFGFQPAYSNNVPDYYSFPGEWWEYLVHAVTVTDDAERIKAAKSIGDITEDDDSDEFLSEFVVDNPTYERD